MGRTILAVIAGYVALFIVTFATFTVAYLILGADGSFQPGSYDPSMAWIGVMFVFGFLAALAGGFVAALVGKSMTGATALAIVVLVLGLLMAIPVVMAVDDDRPVVREGDVGNLEAMQNARQPAWVAFANPIIGAIGVMLGGRLKAGKA